VGAVRPYEWMVELAHKLSCNSDSIANSRFEETCICRIERTLHVANTDTKSRSAVDPLIPYILLVYPTCMEYHPSSCTNTATASLKSPG
jgi:hypothetical protein